jgi:tRNA(Ile)-lysidine synthase
VPTANSAPVSVAEAKSLFAGLDKFPALVLAVSGGPDSTALMWLAARWRKSLKTGPKLIAVTVDHGLRQEAKREAAAVARLARKLALAHRTLRWSGRKPATGLQQAARNARYRLLAEAARKAKAAHILTAHTLDDQAETVLIRMSRGSGLRGLAAMQKVSRLDRSEPALQLVRPLLDIPKTRLIATCRAAKIPYAEDPSNRDPRFTRARLRDLMPALAREGLTAQRLNVLARRLRRADRAIEVAVDAAAAALVTRPGERALAIEAAGFARLPAEIALRLIGRAVVETGDEGPVELSKLESLIAGLKSAQSAVPARFRRTLAGALVTFDKSRLVVERAPTRRSRALTKAGRDKAKTAKTR